MKKKKLIITGMILVILIVVIGIGLDNRLTTSFYSFESEKISESIRIAFISDLHSCKYGEEQKELLDAISVQAPDVVILGGDIYDDIVSEVNADITVTALAEKYPCYFATGNHEFWTTKVVEIKEKLTSLGINVLEGECMIFEAKGQQLCICGIDDYALGKNKVKNQLNKVGETMDNGKYTILLAHHPEKIEEYSEYGFDLVLSGHAHGGLWRIFGLCGVYAPDQGWFPKYTSGVVSFDETNMLISRGLARETTAIPRIFNRPELVIIDIK